MVKVFRCTYSRNFKEPQETSASKGAFNNYVDKGRGSKNVYFCPRLGYKSCPRRGEGLKRQNSLHVVIECPLNISVNSLNHLLLRLFVLKSQALQGLK